MEYLVAIVDANDDVVAEVAAKFAGEGVSLTFCVANGDFEVAGEFCQVLESFEPRLLLDLTAVSAVPSVATEFTGDGLGIVGNDDFLMERVAHDWGVLAKIRARNERSPTTQKCNGAENSNITLLQLGLPSRLKLRSAGEFITNV